MIKEQSTKGKHKKEGLFKNKQPQTLLQLTRVIIVGFIKSIPKYILYIIVIGLISFLYHTYLVIYPNGGFSMGTNRVLDKTLALVGNRARGTILWTVGSYLIFGLLRRTFTLGPITLGKGLGNGIKRVV